MKNFKIVNADTDSISFCKQDETPFTEEEREANLKELNSLFPERIKWEDDGYYPTVVIFKAKNYILYDGKKAKIKGSALKASTKSPALKEFIKRIIDSIIEHRSNQQEIYHEYIKEACKVKDIKRWASRKTISERTLNSERTNETRIKDVLEDTEYVEGDRIHTFFLEKDKLELVERFNGVYHLDALLKSCYDTTKIFANVLDCKELFINYTLKKSKPLLEELTNETSNRGNRDFTDVPRKTCSASSTCSSFSSN